MKRAWGVGYNARYCSGLQCKAGLTVVTTLNVYSNIAATYPNSRKLRINKPWRGLHTPWTLLTAPAAQPHKPHDTVHT